MKLNTIVAGIDFSVPSVESVRWVANDFAPGAEIVLAHVISILEAPPIVRSRYPRRDLLIDTVLAGADKRLREIGQSLAAPRVRIEVREGQPAACLAQIAEETSADMIVVGAHGERPGLQGTLGSTAERLVRVSSCPVLLVRRESQAPLTHLLVPVDHSEDAARALEWAGLLSRAFDAEVTTINVIAAGASTAALAAVAVVAGTPSGSGAAKRPTEAISDQWIEDAVTAGVPRARANSEVCFGIPTREILAAVERLGAGLVVMGRRGEGKFRRAVLGSVVDGVLRGATCPVLVVPAQREGRG